ncbi:phage tail protein [Paraburkholderia sp. Ac-20336]|uniref:phage tail protein n=1 Tax=Burkholderiaceae TaxID=119060 RepID=UPI001421CEE0|nr:MULTISPECIES: tail fiber protein [Burkholderiaceae]MBN3802721.1 phage tail protein [Paraburkholderia sp. Ac-20336]NIF52050.1 phage tail protein [Burkholderia sp. Ax-1724]NIF79660.1 phage tail protein [Paraburkholderia sp. Cy-641]
MSDQYLGEIRMVGFDFAPNGWALCQGQLMSIAQNSPLFALLGTYYGGNGQTTFGLPNLQGRSPVGVGTGLGLAPVVTGEQAGAENITLTQAQLPVHTHATQVTGATQPTTVAVAIPAATGTTATSGPPATSVTNIPGPTTVLGGALSSGHPATVYNTANADTTLKPFNLTVPASLPNVVNANAGSGLPFNTRNPYLGINFIVALTGIFPSRG